MIDSIFIHCTAQTLRYLFGFLVCDDTVSLDAFLNPSQHELVHSVKTKWMTSTAANDDSLTETYLSKCVAPTSVVMWFWNRSGQRRWLHSSLFTQFHYQSFEQYTAFLTCNADFYTKERYTTSFILCLYHVYTMFIACL